MSESVDLQALNCQYAAGRSLQVEPPVWLCENFATAIELAALQEAAFEKLSPAKVSGDDQGYLTRGRSGSNCWVAHTHNAVIQGLAERIAGLVQIPLSHAESFQIVHYGPEQEYRPHYDGWDAGTERGIRCMTRGGQRLVTALLYLNHVDGGGATIFPKLDMQIRPLPGNLVLFHNCKAGTNTRHPHSLHGGMPVLAGEKWAANLWFREHRYR